MVAALDLDLRVRVVEAMEAGASGAQVAERFAIGKSTAGAWYRLWRETGSVAPARQGQPPGSKLDPHEAFILGLVAETKDITLKEIGAELLAAHAVSACPATICLFLKKRGMTVKKRRRTPPSKSARTSAPRARPGSTASPISIPRS